MLVLLPVVCLQLTDAVGALLEGLETIYLWGSVEELVFLFGSTPINPKVINSQNASMNEKNCVFLTFSHEENQYFLNLQLL